MSKKDKVQAKARPARELPSEKPASVESIISPVAPVVEKVATKAIGPIKFKVTAPGCQLQR